MGVLFEEADQLEDVRFAGVGDFVELCKNFEDVNNSRVG